MLGDKVVVQVILAITVIVVEVVTKVLLEQELLEIL